MSLREHVKQRLLQSCFDSSVISIYVHMFAVIGNGYEWNEKGEYVCDLSDNTLNPIEYWQNFIDQYPDQPKYKAQVLKRQFIHDNIDSILDSYDLDDPFSGSHPTLDGAYMTDHVSYKYAAVFNFPDNINQEYAQAIFKFISYWKQALNNTYGVGPQKSYKEAISHWPDFAKKIHNELNKSHERLIDTGHFGTREERTKNHETILKLINKILDEES